MRIGYETRGAPGAVNEDYVVAGVDWAVVLDGATAPAGVESGCVHDVPWLVRRLAAALGAALPADPATLPDLLAGAIKDVRTAHGDTCDLVNPDSPSSTVAIVRRRGGVVECLVLADSPVVVRRTDGSVTAVEDDRIARLPGYTPELVRGRRNRPDGFWVASTDPAAAYEAVTASFPDIEVSAVAMLTDGVTRLVDHFGHGWPDLMDRLVDDGPGSVIDLVREAERTRPGPYRKPHDDATALLMTF